MAFHRTPNYTKEKNMTTIRSLAVALTMLIMPGGVFAQQQTLTTVETTTSTEAAGTISDMSPDTIVVRTETSSSPMNYRSTKSTTYVDETGAPVSVETVKSGLPVTVYSTRDGDHMIAEKVVVRKTTTTTTERPGMQEKQTRTSTTTETKY
jgi:hypothetical protein